MIIGVILLKQNLFHFAILMFSCTISVLLIQFLFMNRKRFGWMVISYLGF